IAGAALCSMTDGVLGHRKRRAPLSSQSARWALPGGVAIELERRLSEQQTSVMANTGSQVWFITGSSRGLGRTLVDAALAAGHHVVATARTPSDRDDVVKRYGKRMRAAALDVTDPEQAVKAVQGAVDAFGRIDVAVNNAGYANIDSAEDLPL